LIKYLGSKRVLVPALVELVGSHAGVRTVLDVFSGTSRVGHALKKAGFSVTANDHNAFAFTLARCYVQADADRLRDRATRLLDELARADPRDGFFTETYCRKSRFFQPRNGAKIEGIREAIAALDLDPDLEAIALTSLMEAADRVDSTTGVQMAYLKSWAPRAHNELALRLPDIVPGPGTARCMDALAFLDEHDADLVYLDPPYNQHSFLGNYHIWETLVRWDAPEVYGVACKRVDCKERTSPFNSKRKIHEAMRQLLERVNAPRIVVSFSNEGYLSREDLLALLDPLGDVEVQSIDYERYVGAKIGIYNPDGRKVGKVSHLKNVEYVFTVRR
jgi:adenine-specific DNA-methyltransferase